MRGRVWIMAVVLCGVLIACKGSSHDNVAAAPVDRCAHRMSVGACVVSAVELFSAPDAFEGRSVSVVLFYPGHGAKVLFASRDSAEINDLASAIVFSRGRTSRSRCLKRATIASRPSSSARRRSLSVTALFPSMSSLEDSQAWKMWSGCERSQACVNSVPSTKTVRSPTRMASCRYLG